MKTKVEVHFEKNIGKIKPMHAVNNGPVAEGAIPGIHSNANLYAEAGIPFVRNHDAAYFAPYGMKVPDRSCLDYDMEADDLMSADERNPVNIVDVHRIFRDFGADENDPRSYDFKATDEHTALTLSSGAKVLYRLGAAIEHNEKHGTYPPKDFSKWARICEHIIRHCNEGWADGYTFGIEYWEIWNEPDCGPCGSNPCWQGTCDEFIEFFETAVRYLKGVFPDLKIGGPTLCTLTDGEYINKLLPAIGSRGIPIDFFSYHWYGSDVDDFVSTIRRAKMLCEENGIGNVEFILDEYNYVLSFGDKELVRKTFEYEINEIGAAFVSSCMLAAQHEPVDILMYYDARPCLMCGLFSLEDLSPLPLWYCMKMFNRLYTLGTETEIINLPAGVFGVSAKDGESAAVMLSYFSDKDDEKEQIISLDAHGIECYGNTRITCVDRKHRGEEIIADVANIVIKPGTVLLIEFLK